MKSKWPNIGLIGSEELTQLFYAPAKALGIDLTSSLDFLEQCDLVIFPNSSDSLPVIKGLEANGVLVRPSLSSHEKLQSITKEPTPEKNKLISVLVARSPHGQAATWTPTLIEKSLTITPVPGLPPSLQESIQKSALEIADQIKLIGVMSVEYVYYEDELKLSNLDLNLKRSSLWTIEGSITDVFEQYLRAALDLPLGDTTLLSSNIVLGDLTNGGKNDMYRPYLHLMARTPKLKFHQYRTNSKIGEIVGHISIIGTDVDYLIEEIKHAQDYFSGKSED